MRLSGVVFLAVEEVERLHARAIQRFGGSLGVRDHGLLSSAVAAPQTTAFGTLVHASLAAMAAALAWALAKNHPFVDGNKRAAAAAAALFLLANGRHVGLESEPWAAIFVNLAAGELSREELAALFAREMGGDVDVDED